MTSALKGICKNIDDTLAEFFSVTQEIMECQHELNKLLADGHILLAKARYSMGAKAVGQLQYDENQMERGARLSVLIDDEEFFLKTNLQNKSSTQQASAVKKRNVAKSGYGVEDISVAVQEIDISGETGTNTEPSNEGQIDPLKWFGVLVPQSLRQSQAKFKRAAEVSCKLASLKVKYCKLQEEFRALKSDKWHLLNDPPEF